jgi:hypothetical protein
MRNNIYAEEFYLLVYNGFLNFNVLYDVIFQKIKHFITTAVRTSNPTAIKFFMRDSVYLSIVKAHRFVRC